MKPCEKVVLPSFNNAWENLSSTDLATFVSVAGSVPMALRLFLTSNINLILIGESMITSYTPSGAPATFPVDITTLSTSSFQIMASGMSTTVPAGYSLLLLATSCQRDTRIFSQVRDFNPIITLPTGTDLSTPFEIVSDWKAYFGELTEDKKICIKAVLIDTSNGSRGAASIDCDVVSLPVIPYYQQLNFRQTAAYVTDPPGAQYMIVSNYTYPSVTAQGNTVGYTTLHSQVIQRGSTTPPDLAGCHYIFSNTPNSVFKMLLPQSGLYSIKLGIGDTAAHQVSCRLYDDTTLFASLSYPSLPGNNFMDAAGNIWSRANWLANNVPITHTFASNILNIEWGPVPNSSQNCVLSTIIVYN